MIIVSQDKMSIINFNNVNEIRVKGNQIIVFDNTYRSSDNCSDILGIYETEERAKEILKEIVAIHQLSKIMESTKDIQIQNEMADKFLEDKMQPFKYEMPKE